MYKKITKKQKRRDHFIPADGNGWKPVRAWNRWRPESRSKLGCLSRKIRKNDKNPLFQKTQSVKGKCFHQVNFEIRKSYVMHFEDPTHFMVWLITINIPKLHIVRSSGPLLHLLSISKFGFYFVLPVWVRRHFILIGWPRDSLIHGRVCC